MKIRIDTTGTFYKEDEKEKLERLGFEFNRSSRLGWRKIPTINPIIEISTIDELLEFVKEWGHIILDREGNNLTIEIYDYYRE
jgi:carbamate kinase